MPAALSSLSFVEGDTLPVISGVLNDDQGAPVDITGYDIKLHLGYETPLVKQADIPTGTDGVFVFTWAEGDLVTLGDGEVLSVDAEVQITSPSGIQTVQRNTEGRRFKIKIYPQTA